MQMSEEKTVDNYVDKSSVRSTIIVKHSVPKTFVLVPTVGANIMRVRGSCESS